MNYNIEVHIKDHAEVVVDNLVISSDEAKLVHFKASIDTAFFIEKGYTSQSQIDDVMKQILNNILEKRVEVEEKNGTYTKQNGIQTQKYRKRIIRFNDLLMVYHNRHFDASKSVNPHLHILGNKNGRLGIGYSYLRRAMEEEAKKYGLKFHFSDVARKTGLTKNQDKSITQMSWIFNQGNKSKIETYLKKDDKLGKVLDLLHVHYLHSENISYFFKTMNIVHQRLNEMDVDYWYKNINLKEKICFSLTPEQEEKIQALRNQKNVELDMSKVFDREVLKYAHGFGSDSLSILVDRFDIPPIDKNALVIISKDDGADNTKEKSNFRNLVLCDVKNAIKNSGDEKSLKESLWNMGYKKASFKTSKTTDGKRQKIGMSLITKKGMKLTLNWSELGMNWSDIVTILMANKKKKKKSEKITSNIEGYRRKQIKKDDNLILYEYRIKQLLVIYGRKNAQTNIVHTLAKKFKVHRSEMYDITTFSSKDSTIVDYADKVVLKKSSSLKGDVSDMLELAVLKGWGLSSLTITGGKKFKEEAQRQINKRLGIREEKGATRLKK